MKLTPQELLAIKMRELANELKRQQWRDALAAKSREFTKTNPLTTPLNPTHFQISKDASLTFNGRRAILRWGKLSIGFQSFDEAQVTKAIARLQDPARYWKDGTLRGVKRLIQDPHGNWVSPTYQVTWENGECHANVLDSELILRGKAGIHAVWADQLDELNGYPGRLVELAAWGTAVVGDLGWRAEHARIVRQLI